MTSAQVVETSVNVISNSPSQDYTHPDDRTLLYDMTPGFKPFTIIIMDVLGGWSRDLEDELNELVGSKSKGVLHNMQKAVISGTLNISRTFKVAT